MSARGERTARRAPGACDGGACGREQPEHAPARASASRASWLALPRRLFVLPIRAYQRVISPLTPPSCRFEPSCSEYGARAILAHGVLKGVLLAAWRILRCHPFSPGGLDPVPGPGRWRATPPCNRDGDSGSSAR